MRPLRIDAPIESALSKQAVVAIGVSGGKDSDACALAVAKYLDQLGHTGPRVLIHSDLGRVEWVDSLPACERLAAHLGWELMVVRRAAGDMLARWEGRWEANVRRYAALECVKLILPWSTPAMRFCTSELKVDVISRALRKRFPVQAIVNVAGIRAQESPSRARMPVSSRAAKLERTSAQGLSWNPILSWTIDDVWAAIRQAGLRPHEAYTRYGASRVSCAFCIMSAEADLRAAAGCADNHDVYRAMVTLEALSTFAFQGARWLADVDPTLLSTELQSRVAAAKQGALARQTAEARIPAHLLYEAGWPKSVPTLAEAELLAQVRREVAAAVGIEVAFTTGESVRKRYQALIAKRDAVEIEDPLFANAPAALPMFPATS